MITTEQLSRLSGTPVNTLRSWQHRGLIQCSEPGQWDLGVTLATVLFSRMLRSNVTTEAAIQATLKRVKLLEEMVRAMMTGGRADASTVLFVDCTLADGEHWLRLVGTRDDAERVISAALKRGVRELHLEDFTPEYVSTLEAFEAVRSRERERELA